jgi:hypothetical protein
MQNLAYLKICGFVFMNYFNISNHNKLEQLNLIQPSAENTTMTLKFTFQFQIATFSNPNHIGVLRAGEEITVHGGIFPHQTKISWSWVAKGIKDKEGSSGETMGLRLLIGRRPKSDR